MSTIDKLSYSVTSRGYEIIKVDTIKEKVLVYMPENQATPYVVWTFNEDGDTFWGHYFGDYGKAEEHFIDVTN